MKYVYIHINTQIYSIKYINVYYLKIYFFGAPYSIHIASIH